MLGIYMILVSVSSFPSKSIPLPSPNSILTIIFIINMVFQSTRPTSGDDFAPVLNETKCIEQTIPNITIVLIKWHKQHLKFYKNIDRIYLNSRMQCQDHSAWIRTTLWLALDLIFLTRVWFKDPIPHFFFRSTNPLFNKLQVYAQNKNIHIAFRSADNQVQ